MCLFVTDIFLYPSPDLCFFNHLFTELLGEVLCFHGVLYNTDSLKVGPSRYRCIYTTNSKTWLHTGNLSWSVSKSHIKSTLFQCCSKIWKLLRRVNTFYGTVQLPGYRFNSRHMASHLSMLSYLTRSITLSLGAELTGSSLIMMISSPGISLPSDGPPVNTQQTTVKWYKQCIVTPLLLIFLGSPSCGSRL